MQLTVLGSAGAAPLEGACPCYAVSGGEGVVLLDCGPGALERLWRMDLLGAVEAIVISHMHADHVLDLLLLAGELVTSQLGAHRPRLYVPDEDGPRVLGQMDSAFSRGAEAGTRFHRAFEVLEYGVADNLLLAGLSFTFAPTGHAQPCFAARITDGRSSLVYGADGSPTPALLELARDADLLLLEATYADDERAAAAQGHMTARQAGELAHAAGARRLLLTHLLPDERERVEPLAAAAFGGPAELALEGLACEF